MDPTILRVGLAVLAVLVPAAAGAQVANPLPRATGMGGNYTAIARGLGAPAWNPAGLGMPDNPRGSLALLPVAATAGIEPITAADLARYDGQLIPHATRAEWLERIRAAGGATGIAGADVTYVAFSLGRFAVSASSSGRARVDVSPDVAEILFFGNAGVTGEPGDYQLEGSEYDVAATTTFAASTAVPLALALGPLPDQRFAIGVTVKYTIGNFLMLGRENESAIGVDPLAVNVSFPVVHTPLPDSSGNWGAGGSLNNGTGWGLDVGAAWQGGGFSAGLVVHNLINTFQWDRGDLEYRPGIAIWTADTSYTSFEEQDVADAPADLMERVDELYTFSPVVAAGAAARVTRFLTVTGEVRHALEEDLHVGPRSHLGVGAELAIIPFLPLRAGVSRVSGGYQLSGGLGLVLGPVQLSGAAAVREGDIGDDTVGAFALTFGVR